MNWSLNGENRLEPSSAKITECDVEFAGNPKFNQNLNSKIYIEESKTWKFVDDEANEYCLTLDPL